MTDYFMTEHNASDNLTQIFSCTKWKKNYSVGILKHSQESYSPYYEMQKLYWTVKSW